MLMLIRRRLTIAHLDYVNQRFAAALQQMPRLDKINEQLNQTHVPQLSVFLSYEILNQGCLKHPSPS